MSRVPVDDHECTNLQTKSEQKACLIRAEQLQISERDHLRVLDLLENPPAPNAKLRAAAAALQPLK